MLIWISCTCTMLICQPAPMPHLLAPPSPTAFPHQDHQNTTGRQSLPVTARDLLMSSSHMCSTTTFLEPQAAQSTSPFATTIIALR